MNTLSKIALLAMLSLLALAIIYYKERAYFADFPFGVFTIINKGQFNITSHRYGEIVYQAVPYLCAKMHMSVRAILFISAISSNLFYLFITAVLVYVFRQYRLAILMALFYFLFVSASFIPPTDPALGVAFMFLFFALTIYFGKKGINVWLILVPIIILAFITFSLHFILLLPTVFLWVYFVIERENWPYSRRDTIVLSMSLVCTFVIKYLDIALGPKSYDSAHLYGVTHFSLQDIYDSLSTPVVRIFLYRCLVNYWVAALVFFTGIIYLLAARKFLLASWTLLATVGYLIIMGLTYGNFNENVLLWHIESEWACLGIIAATPLVFAFLPSFKLPIATFVLLGVFVIRFLYINSFIGDYTWRLHIQTTILKQMRKKNISKLALTRTIESSNEIMLDWAMPMESLLMSSVHGDMPQLTFFYVDSNDTATQSLVESDNGFFNGWYMAPPDQVNPRYFTFDTTCPYRVMSYEELLKN